MGFRLIWTGVKRMRFKVSGCGVLWVRPIWLQGSDWRSFRGLDVPCEESSSADLKKFSLVQLDTVSGAPVLLADCHVFWRCWGTSSHMVCGPMSGWRTVVGLLSVGIEVGVSGVSGLVVAASSVGVEGGGVVFCLLLAVVSSGVSSFPGLSHGPVALKRVPLGLLNWKRLPEQDSFSWPIIPHL